MKMCMSKTQFNNHWYYIISSQYRVLGNFRGTKFSRRMWDMSALIRRCENFGLFYSFCSQLVVDAESQTRNQDVGRHVDVRTITFLEGLLLSRRSY